MSNYKVEWSHLGDYVEHLDGVPWYDKPAPPRWHICRTQTRGLILGSYIERCICGAIRNGPGRWSERNRRVKESQ